MQTVIFASGNPGKLKEMSEILARCSFLVKPQSEFNVNDIEETGLTFVENSILKARHAASVTSMPAIADDSGLEVDALNGAPGIYSARFSAMHDGEPGDSGNNQLLLEKLKHVPVEQRSARFRCVIVFLRHEHDPAPIIAQGVWNGSILMEPDGERGFGYDPLFLAPETGTSAATLKREEKNSLSHRGKALRLLINRLDSLRNDPMSGYTHGQIRLGPSRNARIK